ncbi:MAG: PaaI family thioesterase [Alphaproteobacteria bacterium]|nr:PaaI family thioesterase [Alphaproteobacteria bacterium]
MILLGASLDAVFPGGCRISLPYRPELSQQHGFFHGGVIGAVADNCGGYAAFTMAAADASILTVEYKLNIVAPGRGDRLEGEGRVVRAGRRIVVCESEIFAVAGGERSLCAVALGTLMLLPGRPDGPSQAGPTWTRRARTL